MINIEQDKDTIKISYFDENGEVGIYPIPIKDEDRFDWVDTPGKYVPGKITWDGKPVRKKKTFFLSNWRIIEMLHKQPQHIKDIIYQNNQPKKFFLDIETQVIDGFPDPKSAKEKVTLITFAKGDLVAGLGYKPLSGDQIKKIGEDINKYLATKGYPPMKFVYQAFDSEYDMLYAFFHKYIQKMPLISGWNVIGFDWTFLVNRAKRLNIDPGVASVTGKLIGRDNLPIHRVIVDYMEIYKKWDRVIFKDNNTLDYVAKAATGLGKIKYTGSLQDLYENDYYRYVFYGTTDSILVQLIDEKISTMQVYLSLSSLTFTPLYKVFSPIAMTENVLVREYLSRNLMVPKRDGNPTRKSYEGAFVFPPKPDLYEWVPSFDFASLYPSIMRQWNMSPETFVKKVLDIATEIALNKDYIGTASGAIFDGKEDSAFRTILENLYGERKKTKSMMKAYGTEIIELEKLLK